MSFSIGVCCSEGRHFFIGRIFRALHPLPSLRGVPSLSATEHLCIDVMSVTCATMPLNNQLVPQARPTTAACLASQRRSVARLERLKRKGGFATIMDGTGGKADAMLAPRSPSRSTCPHLATLSKTPASRRCFAAYHTRIPAVVERWWSLNGLRQRKPSRAARHVAHRQPDHPGGHCCPPPGTVTRRRKSSVWSIPTCHRVRPWKSGADRHENGVRHVTVASVQTASVARSISKPGTAMASSLLMSHRTRLTALYQAVLDALPHAFVLGDAVHPDPWIKRCIEP